MMNTLMVNTWIDLDMSCVTRDRSRRSSQEVHSHSLRLRAVFSRLPVFLDDLVRPEGLTVICDQNAFLVERMRWRIIVTRFAISCDWLVGSCGVVPTLAKTRISEVVASVGKMAMSSSLRPTLIPA